MKIKSKKKITLKSPEKVYDITVPSTSNFCLENGGVVHNSAVARHYGKDAYCYIGATKPETAFKHPMIEMTTWFGGKFKIINSGFNASLNHEMMKDLEGPRKGSFYMYYGITTEPQASNEKVMGFHGLGANQVRNIPDHITDLVLPAGSCNSCTSIIYGLHKYPPKNLRNIYLIGIGPDKIPWIEERFRKISAVDRDCEITFLERNMFSPKPKYNIHYVNLHENKFVESYAQEMPETLHHIDFHPTYEGKVFRYANYAFPEVMKRETTLFWIIGSKPQRKYMEHLKSELGEFPEKIALWD